MPAQGGVLPNKRMGILVGNFEKNPQTLFCGSGLNFFNPKRYILQNTTLTGHHHTKTSLLMPAKGGRGWVLPNKRTGVLVRLKKKNPELVFWEWLEFFSTLRGT